MSPKINWNPEATRNTSAPTDSPCMIVENHWSGSSPAIAAMNRNSKAARTLVRARLALMVSAMRR